MSSSPESPGLASLRRLVEARGKATPGQATVEFADHYGNPDPLSECVDVWLDHTDGKLAGLPSMHRLAVCEPEHSEKGGYSSVHKRNADFFALAFNELALHGPALLSRLEWLERVAAAAKEYFAATSRYEAAEGKEARLEALLVLSGKENKLVAALAAEPGNGEPK